MTKNGEEEEKVQREGRERGEKGQGQEEEEARQGEGDQIGTRWTHSLGGKPNDSYVDTLCISFILKFISGVHAGERSGRPGCPGCRRCEKEE